MSASQHQAVSRLPFEDQTYDHGSLTIDHTDLVLGGDAEGWSLDLSKIYYRSPADQSVATSVYQSSHARHASIAFAKRAIDRRRSEVISPRSITRQIYLLRNVYDWLAERAIEQLGTAQTDHLTEMISDYAEQGWARALKIGPRWINALSTFKEEDLELAFHVQKERGTRRIDAIRQDYWRPRLAWGGAVPVPAEVRPIIEAATNTLGTVKWSRCKDSYLPPSRLALRNTITCINQWHATTADCDKPSARVTMNSNKLAHRLARRSTQKTEILSHTDAGSLLKSAIFMLDELLPPLLRLLSDPRLSEKRPSYLRSSQELLASSDARAELEVLLGRRITRWVWAPSRTRRQSDLCVDQLVAAVQGAAFIIICIMNGRRSGEVCHPRNGLRDDSLKMLGESTEMATMSFYIEKTLFRREPFYVNQLTIKAYKAALELRRVLMPPSREVSSGGSIFLAGRRNGASIPEGKMLHFSPPTCERRTRSLSSFFEIAGERCSLKQVRSHSFRRFFALLYYYRYDNADLLSLQQHLRHSSVSNTIHYVTSDTGAFFPEVTAPITEAQRERGLPVEELEQVSYERLRQSVEQCLDGKASAGGFTKLVRGLYHRLASATTSPDDRPDAIARQLAKSGHTTKPMPFGLCHSSQRRSTLGNCRHDGQLAHAQASPSLCFSCPYHFTSAAYTGSLRQLERTLATNLENVGQHSVQADHTSHQLKHVRWLLSNLGDARE